MCTGFIDGALESGWFKSLKLELFQENLPMLFGRLYTDLHHLSHAAQATILQISYSGPCSSDWSFSASHLPAACKDERENYFW